MSEASWRSRIVGEADIAPDELLANPANWRIHPKSQQQALAATLDQVGWVQRVIVNQRTGHVVDGHLRVDLALRRSEPTVPVLYVDLSADEERTVLASLDPLASMAATDSDKLAELLAQTSISDDVLASMLRDMAEAAAPSEAPPSPQLADRFIVPPFSVLDARAGYWQERKRQWLAYGIRSEVGRGANLLEYSDTILGLSAQRKGKKKGVTYNIGNKDDWEASKAQRPDGTLYKSFSAIDPRYYAKKNEAEAKLGRQLTPEEFEASGLYEAPDIGGITDHGTSVFDPVLTELVYRWFSAPGASILDPFAGGSVRGIVAAMTGRDYTGVELRDEQVQANRQQADDILGVPRAAPETISDPDAITPVEQRGSCWAKRDDLFAIGGATGGKARATLALADGAEGIISVSARTSPQNLRAALIAQHLGIPARCHTGSGQETSYTAAVEATGAELIAHNPPRLTVMRARAHADASEHPGWAEVPFGAKHPVTVEAARRQTANVPADVRRIVVAVGSGTTLAGILHGLRDRNLTMPVIGVVVGADPRDTLDELAPAGWRDMVTLVEAGLPFESAAPVTSWEGIALDPYYEAKVVAHLEPGDLFWLIGGPTQLRDMAETERRPTWITGDSMDVQTLAPGEYDLVFSCPPYADLEVYSDDPRDLSTMAYADFMDAYRQIIERSCAMLKPDRFAAFVVGEVRGQKDGGSYLNFVGDTIRAFEDAGLRYYNEAILVTPLGTLPVRVGRQMEVSRKLGKTHQNLLVFVKGDPMEATRAAGKIEVEMPDEMLSAWQAGE